MEKEDIKLKRDGGEDGWIGLATLYQQLAYPASINYTWIDRSGWMDWCDSLKNMRKKKDEGGERRSSGSVMPPDGGS